LKNMHQKKVSMNLFDNAIDSFNESLKKYEEAINGDVTAFKFVILHFVHFTELLFKDYLHDIHPLLVYKNPFSKKIDENTNTIGLWEAINFLENDKKEISQNFKDDLEYIKKIRNKIEHYKFDLDIEKLNIVLGRLMNAIIEFDNLHSEYKVFSPENIEEYISEENFNIFKKLAIDYKSKYDIAKEEADKAMNLYISEYSDGGEPQKIYDCPECGYENFLIPNDDSPTGYKCVYCDNEESYDIEIKCDICGSFFEKDRMIYMEDVGYICPIHEINPENKRYND